MPNFVQKITPLLGAALLLWLAGPVAAEVPERLLTGAMENFTVSKPVKPAPEIAFVDGDDTPLSLAAFKGKVVLVNFWATWCAPCRREMPDLDALEARFGGPEFAVVAISVDRQGPSVVPEFFAEVGVRHLKVYNDRSMKSARAFLAPGLPTTVVLDRQSRIQGRLIGPAEWASPEAIALIRHFLDQAKGDEPLTKAEARD